MNSKIILFARRLYEKGHFKLAQKVLDLSKSRQHRNREVLKQMKEEDKWKALEEQHRLDRPALYSDEPAGLLYPEQGQEDEARSPSSRRVEVSVLYPSFDEDGALFFDEENGVQEAMTVTSAELAELEAEEVLGYLKILDKKKLFPKS